MTMYCNLGARIKKDLQSYFVYCGDHTYKYYRCSTTVDFTLKVGLTELFRIQLLFFLGFLLAFPFRSFQIIIHSDLNLSSAALALPLSHQPTVNTLLSYPEISFSSIPFHPGTSVSRFLLLIYSLSFLSTCPNDFSLSHFIYLTSNLNIFESTTSRSGSGFVNVLIQTHICVIKMTKKTNDNIWIGFDA